MILIHVLTNSMKKAIEISDFLTKERLILNAVIAKDVIIRKNEKGKIVSEDRVLIMGKTKSLLFNKIDEQLHEHFDEMPVLYSVPITHMDWEQAEYLVKETQRA